MSNIGFPSEEVAHEVVQRAISIKEVVDVIGVADSMDELIKSHLDYSKLTPHLDKQFRFNVEGLKHTLKMKETISLIEKFEPCGFNDKLCNLK